MYDKVKSTAKFPLIGIVFHGLYYLSPTTIIIIRTQLSLLWQGIHATTGHAHQMIF